MLLESRLYSFIDQTEGFTVHFLDGQKLVNDIALIHKVAGEGFHFFRDILLSTQLLLAYLKPEEGLGVYIDSEDPYFRFKLEMNDSGQMRTLLIPEEFKSFPKKITGKCRLTKLAPGEKTPYNSIVDLQETNLADIINTLLKVSYQLNSQIYLSESGDQSIMISKLPSIDINRVQTTYTLSVEEYWKKNKLDIENFFTKFSSDYSEIQNFFENKNLLLLASREVKFKCTCSKERMNQGIWSLIQSTGIDHVFLNDEQEITTKCDYCHNEFVFEKKNFMA